MSDNMIPPAGRGSKGPPRKSGDPLAAPLLSAESLAALRELAAESRWPRQKLTLLAVARAEAERELHAARARRDAAAAEAAHRRRQAAHAALLAEQGHVADVFLASLGHAVAFRPAETAEMFVELLADPRVKSALVPLLEALLGPVVDWLHGGQVELAERVEDLEAVAAGGRP